MSDPFPPCNDVISSEVSERTADFEHYKRRKHLIRTSWQALRFGPTLGATHKLFEVMLDKHPSFETLLQRRSKEWLGQKLIDAITYVVNALDDMDAAMPMLYNLGIRHIDYGVGRVQFETVTECFLQSMNCFLQSQMPNGSAQTYILEVLDGWEWLLTFVTETMADAAEDFMEEQEALRREQGGAGSNSTSSLDVPPSESLIRVRDGE